MDHPSTPQPEPAECRRAYEVRDVDWRSIVLFAGLLVAGSILIHIALYLLMFYFEAEAKQADPRLSPFADVKQAPPPPRLQARPALDYDALAARERTELRKVDWVDRKRGIVQIPIDRAMELLLERGLPKTKPQPIAGATNVKAPTSTQPRSAPPPARQRNGLSPPPSADRTDQSASDKDDGAKDDRKNGRLLERSQQP